MISAVPQSPGYVNYSSISTVVGWSSFTEKQIWYSRNGKMLTVHFRIYGTSNSTTTTFTLPHTSIVAGPTDQSGYISKAVDNGGTGAFGRCRVVANTAIVDCYKDADGTAWAASGSKSIQGAIILFIQ